VLFSHHLDQSSITETASFTGIKAKHQTYYSEVALIIIYFFMQDRLVSVLFGLLRKHKFHFIHLYRNEAYSTIKSTIKQVQNCFCSIFIVGLL
jgi:hypothetical protein